MAGDRRGCLPNIVPGQDTSADGGERAFGIYDLFEGTEQTPFGVAEQVASLG